MGHMACSLFAHTSDVDDLLEGLDGVFKNWLNRLHDTESSFHIVDLWLHTFDGFHFSGNFNKWLSIIKSLKDSSSKSFLDILDGSGLSNSGITITSRFGWECRVQFRLEGYKELVFIHGFIGFHSFKKLWFMMVMVVMSGSNGGDKGSVFHC